MSESYNFLFSYFICFRRALGLDPGVVVAFNDSDDDDKKDPEDHSRCKSCLAMAKEQDGKMQDVKLEK